MLTTFTQTKIVNQYLIEFGSPVWIDDFVLIVARKRIVIGDYVHIAAFTTITGDGELEIGDFCGISYGNRLLLNTDDFLGEHGLNNPTVPDVFRGKIRANVKTVFGKHVVTGPNCTFMPGIVVGEGCAIGANSFVKEDCAPWGIYGGVPAKRLKNRRRDVILDIEQKMRGSK
jgi:acetyltransferase-like isoleucine patch superfamily enzyme